MEAIGNHCYKTMQRKPISMYIMNWEPYQLCRLWRHCRLLLRQPAVSPVMAKLVSRQLSVCTHRLSQMCHPCDGCVSPTEITFGISGDFDGQAHCTRRNLWVWGARKPRGACKSRRGPLRGERGTYKWNIIPWGLNKMAAILYKAFSVVE